MRLYFDPNPGANMEGDDEFRTRVTNAYLEAEWKLQDGYLVAYMIVTNDHTLLLCANWGENLNFINDMLQDESSCALLAKTWPLLAALLSAGFDERFSDGCLQRLNDPDTGNPAWMLCTLVGNLDLNKSEDWFGERTMAGMNVIFTRCGELMDELNSRQPDELTHYGMDILKGVGKFAASVAVMSLFGVNYEE